MTVAPARPPLAVEGSGVKSARAKPLGVVGDVYAPSGRTPSCELILWKSAFRSATWVRVGLRLSLGSAIGLGSGTGAGSGSGLGVGSGLAFGSATLVWCAARWLLTNRKEVRPMRRPMATPPLLPTRPAMPVATCAACTSLTCPNSAVRTNTVRWMATRVCEPRHV